MDRVVCKLCGHPMPPGEEMFNYHGHSGPCPAPPLSNRASIGGLPPDAALRIARFCWPHSEWILSEPLLVWERGRGHRTLCFGEESSLRLAERAIVERGLGERYGEELIEAVDGIYTERQTLEAMFAVIRTAPLDAIVRALLAVVEAEEKKHQAPGAADEALAPTPAARQPGESQAEAVGSERLTSREPGPTSEVNP